LKKLFLKKSVSHAPREPSIKEDEDERSSLIRKSPPVYPTKQSIIAPTATISTTGLLLSIYILNYLLVNGIIVIK
jgi:hypothetical protein